MRLENWCVTTHPHDFWQAPELRVPCLSGEVYNDYRGRSDGKRIVTSGIVKVTAGPNAVVTTESGSEYILGEVDPEFVKWCQDHSVHVPTEEEPIRMK